MCLYLNEKTALYFFSHKFLGIQIASLQMLLKHIWHQYSSDSAEKLPTPDSSSLLPFSCRSPIQFTTGSQPTAMWLKMHVKCWKPVTHPPAVGLVQSVHASRTVQHRCHIQIMQHRSSSIVHTGVWLGQVMQWNWLR